MEENISVGIVSPQLMYFSEPLHLKSGATLANYMLMYKTYGTLNFEKSNAVLVFVMHLMHLIMLQVFIKIN